MANDLLRDDERDGENLGTPSNLELSELNQVSSELLETIKAMSKTLKNSRKIKTSEKSQILARLMKSYSDLIKTHRALNGLDSEGGRITAGVIIIPGKAENWVEAAKEELGRAKLLINQPVEDPVAEIPEIEYEEGFEDEHG